MKVAGFYNESMANGLGWRAVLFVSGCPHHCPGCHNKEAQDFNYGQEFNKEEIINYLSGIMAEDFGIFDIRKCIDDLLAIYNKEKLVNTRNEIIKKLENTNNMSKEEIHKLEESLNSVILKLAKVK